MTLVVVFEGLMILEGLIMNVIVITGMVLAMVLVLFIIIVKREKRKRSRDEVKMPMGCSMSNGKIHCASVD